MKDDLENDEQVSLEPKPQPNVRKDEFDPPSDQSDEREPRFDPIFGPKNNPRFGNGF